MKRYDLIVVGAGPSGLSAAIEAAKEGMRVIFFSAVNKDCENIEGIEYVTTNQNEALKEKNKIKGAINRYI